MNDTDKSFKERGPTLNPETEGGISGQGTPQRAQPGLGASSAGRLRRFFLILVCAGVQETGAQSSPSTQTPAAGEVGRTGPQAVSIGMIQTAELNPEQPLFVPTHPRVTTTLRFPGPLGAPEGRGFTEDESKTPGEYLVAWTRGDSHLTVTPLAGAGALNLNVPFRGDTYVVYFYPAERQFQALASLRLVQGGMKPRQLPASIQNEKSTGVGELPTARLLGLLDKIKLLRAVAPGKGQTQLAATLGLELSCPTNKGGEEKTSETRPDETVEISITHVVRDPSMGALAFALRLKNRSTQALTLKSIRFSAHCGASSFQQVLAENPDLLPGGEETEAFVAIETEALSPMRAENTWQIKAAQGSLSRPEQSPGLAADQTGLAKAGADKQQIP